ncbi:ribosome biogenesis GTPase Der [Patescibacteria group bacterium]
MKVKQIKTNLPLVAIVGRTNVGKSTLFNKFIEQQKALISKIAGTTRDLNFGVCEWQGKQFEAVDTGGLFEAKLKSQNSNLKTNEKSIGEQVEKKARKILDKADLILFMVDAKNGIMKDDRLIAQLLKKFKKQYILVTNKIDSTKLQTPQEFQKLGLGNGIGISATTGSGVGDLLDEITKTLKHKNTKTLLEKNKNSFRVSIIGKPNVGKSSLLNQILGEEKVIVSPVPHTTREPQNTLINFKNNQIELIDTAGIRRKNKIQKDSLEKSGIQMSIKALKKSDIALFVIDISKNLSAQDAQLAGLIIQSGISVIFVANKYDLLEIDKNTTKELTTYIYKYFPFLTWAPIIFTSAKSGKNCQKILNLMLEIKEAREKKIDKTELNDFVKYLMKKMPPHRQPRKKGSPKKSRAFIAKVKQVDTHRPIFEIHVTNITKIPEPYMRYLENNIRKRFNFLGTPITLRVVRNKTQNNAISNRTR